jgi:hypothetical protein
VISTSRLLIQIEQRLTPAFLNWEAYTCISDRIREIIGELAVEATETWEGLKTVLYRAVSINIREERRMRRKFL